MNEPYDHSRREGVSSESVAGGSTAEPYAGPVEPDLDDARENVFEGWPSSEDVSAFAAKQRSSSEPFSTAEPPRERFNGEVTSRLLASALAELERAGVEQGAVTVMPVPGAFELPIGAMALARTRRFACIIALGCVIRGDTPHFDYVASEAASGLQLAALETGVPVSFGVLTLERADQADARVDKGAEAARTALEMADLFSHLRAAAAR